MVFGGAFQGNWHVESSDDACIESGGTSYVESGEGILFLHRKYC